MAARRQKRDSSETPHCVIKAGGLVVPQVNKVVPFMDVEITKETFKWTEAQEDSINGLKQSLLMAPVLGLPDMTKPFHLYVDQGKGIVE